MSTSLTSALLQSNQLDIESNQSAVLTGTGLLIVSCIIILAILGLMKRRKRETPVIDISILIVVALIAVALGGFIQEFFGFYPAEASMALVGNLVFGLTIVALGMFAWYQHEDKKPRREDESSGGSLIALILFALVVVFLAPLVPMLMGLMELLSSIILAFGGWIIGMLPSS